jgi:hypothetical protein
MSDERASGRPERAARSLTQTGNPDQRRAVIRFALHQLGSQNGHHTFEHICRNVAAQRIASNIVPATGPVAAAGDQGRDFETFPTYLRSEDVPGSSFIALVSEGAVVFACTPQQDKLQAKLNTDVASIAGSGQPVGHHSSSFQPGCGDCQCQTPGRSSSTGAILSLRA